MHEQILMESEVCVARQEANFDRACDEAMRMAISMFGIDEDGHSSRVQGWERDCCAVRIKFVSYERTGWDNNVYVFDAIAVKFEEKAMVDASD